MPHHILRDEYRDEVLPVVHQESDSVRRCNIKGKMRSRCEYRFQVIAGATRVNAPNEIRQNRTRPRLRLYRNMVRQRLLEVREGDEVRSCEIQMKYKSSSYG